MGIFRKSPKDRLLAAWQEEPIRSPFPVQHFDPEKRYDIYCTVAGEHRLYDNYKLIAMKTLNDIGGLVGGLREFLEIEASDGTRATIPIFPIHLICEHGVKPAYTVLRKATES